MVFKFLFLKIVKNSKQIFDFVFYPGISSKTSSRCFDSAAEEVYFLLQLHDVHQSQPSCGSAILHEDSRGKRLLKMVRIISTLFTDFPTFVVIQNQTYELYAVIDHFGDLRSGHYSSRIRSQPDSGWYQFNDNSVTAVSSVTVEQKFSLNDIIFKLRH